MSIAALAVSCCALVVSGLAAKGTWAQARANREAVAPRVEATYARAITPGRITVTFDGSTITAARISCAHGVEALAVKGEHPSDSQLRLRDVVNGTRYELAARFDPTASGPVVLEIVLRGPGFGRITRRVEARNNDVFVY